MSDDGSMSATIGNQQDERFYIIDDRLWREIVDYFLDKVEFYDSL